MIRACHNILFQGPMVVAIGEGRKTVTRRVIKDQPDYQFSDSDHLKSALPSLLVGARIMYANWPHTVINHRYQGRRIAADRCPYVATGNLLRVRETWAAHFMWTGIKPSEILVDDGSCFFYQADGAITGGCSASQREKVWRPSIFMPNKIARYYLENLGVRVERVQEITAEDVWDEGFRPPVPSGVRCAESPEGFETWSNARREEWFVSQGRGVYISQLEYVDRLLATFEEAWDSMHAKPKPIKERGQVVSYVSYPWAEGYEVREHRGLPWHVYGNPALFRVEFKRTEARP